jgi:predicted  nucleic acid-binding Zn-ribbon protein
MTVAFDTLKLARRLEAAGFPTKQAQDTAEALAETLTANVASQTDIQAIQGDIRELGLQLRAEISEVRAEIREVETRLRAEIREVELKLRADMASLRAELIKWMVGVGIAAVMATGGMIVTLGVAILRALPHP